MVCSLLSATLSVAVHVLCMYLTTSTQALSKCEFRGWGKHDCSHQHDVAVCCNDDCVAILKAKNA